MAINFKGLYIGGQWVNTASHFDDLNPVGEHGKSF